MEKGLGFDMLNGWGMMLKGKYLSLYDIAMDKEVKINDLVYSLEKRIVGLRIWCWVVIIEQHCSGLVLRMNRFRNQCSRDIDTT